MGEGIVIPTVLDTSGFKKGTKQLEGAIKSLSRKVSDISKSTERVAQKMINPFKRLLPTLLGVGSVYGILSKAINAFMSQNEELSARMSSIWTALGNLLGPIITQIIDWVSTAVSYFLSFLKLLGVTSKSASQLSQKANGAAKELQRTLAGFDELNVLQDNNGGGGGKDGSLKDIDPSEWMTKLAELLKNKLWDEAADMIIEKLNDIIYKVRDKAYEVGEKIGEYLQGIVHVIARVLDEVDWKQLGVGIANFLNGLLKEVEGINFGEDLGKLLVAKFTIAFKILDGFLEQVDLGRIGEIVGEAVKGAFDAISRAIEGANPAKIGQNIADFFNRIDWMGIGESLLRLLKNAWNFAVTLFHNALTKTDWQAIGNAIGKFIKGIDWNQLAEDIKTLLKDAWDAAWDLFLGILGKGEEQEPPIIKQLEDLKEAAEKCAESVGNAFGPIWNDIIKPFLKWTGNSVIPEIIGDLTDRFESLNAKLTLFAEMWLGIKEILFGDTKAGWERITTAISEYNDAMSQIEPTWQHLLRALEILPPKAEEVSDGLEGATSKVATAMSGVTAETSDLSGKFDELNENIVNVDDVLDGFAQEFDDIDNALARFNSSMRVNGAETGETTQRAQEYANSLGDLEEKLLAYAQGSENTEEATRFLKESFIELGDTSKEHTNIQQELYEVGNRYLNLLGKQKTVMEGTSGAIQDIAEATERTSESTIKMADSEEQAAQSVITANEEIKKVPGTTESAERGYSGLAEGAKETTDETKVTTSEMVALMKTDWDSLGATITAQATTIKETVISAITSMRDAVVPAFQIMAQDSIHSIDGLYQGVSNTFGILASQSFTWGYDMMANLANGMAQGFNNMVEPTIRNVVEVIRQYVHFSKPDKGALADFDEYGPDMMKLYAEGIESEKSRVVAAIDDVANSVASEMNGENIQLPTVAGGGFLPYGVESQSLAGTAGGEVNSEVLAAILQLQELITQFENSVNNMQWVAKFGNIRAVVEEITQMQKQAGRARG